MGKPKFPYTTVFLLLPLLFSCIFADRSEKIPLAKVGDEILYMSELESVLPNNLSREDSILMAEDYIKKWVTTELLIKKAHENLTMAQRDVSKELEEYRNSLIIYRYKKELLADKMDTLVNDEDVRQFYDANKQNFILANDILKAIYIKIPLQVSKPEQARAFCEMTTGEDLKELQEFCLRNAESYQFYLDEWVDARIVLQNLPDMPEDFSFRNLKNSLVEKRDEKYYYLVCVIGYGRKGTVAPLEYVSNNIRDIIINNRKTEFLKKIEEDVYVEGIRNQKFKIYHYEAE